MPFGASRLCDYAVVYGFGLPAAESTLHYLSIIELLTGMRHSVLFFNAILITSFLIHESKSMVQSAVIFHQFTTITSLHDLEKRMIVYIRVRNLGHQLFFYFPPKCVLPCLGFSCDRRAIIVGSVATLFMV
ncbi:hypothetical protein ACJX0J_041366 [Zea mays]